MHLQLTTNALPYPRDLGKKTPTVEAYLRHHPDLKDPNITFYSPEMFASKYNIVRSVRAATAQMQCDDNILNKPTLCKLANSFLRHFDLSNDPDVQRQQQKLQAFAQETAHIVNASSLPEARAQAVRVLTILQARKELTDFPIWLDEYNFNEAMSSNEKLKKDTKTEFKAIDVFNNYALK